MTNFAKNKKTRHFAVNLQEVKNLLGSKKLFPIFFE